jgi:hypothetical protein
MSTLLYGDVRRVTYLHTVLLLTPVRSAWATFLEWTMRHMSAYFNAMGK